MSPDYEFISRQMSQNFAVAIEDGIKNGLPDAAERRRYALLQAATAMYIMGVRESVDDWSPSVAIQETEKLLAEIETRRP